MVFGKPPEATDFRGLLLVLRARTGLLQRELAAAVGVTERTIQTWEAGSNYPSAERLKRLIEVCLRHGGFGAGREEQQAAELWGAAARDAPRLSVPFDREWFAGLLAPASAVSWPPTKGTTPRPRGTPDPGTAAVGTPVVHGRAHELETLSTWVLSDGCRVVGVLGMGADGSMLGSGSLDGTIRLWQVASGVLLRTLRRDRCYERMNIAGLTGVTHAQREALLALGALE